MAHIIRVYYGDRIYSLDLTMHKTQASIGSGNNDSVRLDAHGLSENHIKFINANNTWTIKAKKHLYRENSRVSSEPLFEGVTYTVHSEPQIFIAVHPKQEDSTKIVKLNSNMEFNIGRDHRNEIVFSNMRTSSKHCKIYKIGEGYKIQDCGSKNGTFVNGKRVTERVLCDGDIVNVSVYQMIFENNTLSFMNVGNDVDFKVPTEEKGSVWAYNEPEEGERRSGTFSLFDENDEAPKSGTVSVFDL